MLSKGLPLLRIENLSSLLVSIVRWCCSYVLPFWLWKNVELEKLHGRLYHWFLSFFIGIYILWIEPPPLHSYTYSNFFMITFLTSSWVDYFMTSSGYLQISSFFVVYHSFYEKTQTIRHSSCSNKRRFISKKVKLDYIIL